MLIKRFAKPQKAFVYAFLLLFLLSSFVLPFINPITAYAANPDTPTNTAPADLATDVPVTPTLQSSAFSDSDGGDTHKSSQWQVSTGTGGGFIAGIVYDSGTDAVNLTSIEIPAGTLASNTVHYWQVRHQDNNDDWSSYSTETSFTTTVTVSPNTPTNTTPATGTQLQSTTLTLVSSAFSDADGSDAHQASQWRISSTIVTTPSTVPLEFKDNNPAADTIERTTGSFVTDGWVAGMNITVSGSASNNNTYMVDTVTALIITLSPAAVLANEGPGAGATLSGANYASPVYDSGTDTSNLINIAVPLDTLNIHDTYYWQVRHQDNNGNWSAWSAETSFGTLKRPNTPVNSDPISGATDVSTEPTLESSAFSDPDAGDTHQSSQWQVSTGTGGGFIAGIVYESGIDDTNKETIDIPASTLNYATKYYWRVRYQDDHSIWSLWSAETSFTTIASGVPNTPSNVSPVDGSIDIELAPVLNSSAFSDPNAGDAHTASLWQISTDDAADFVANIIYDSGVSTSLVQLTTPISLLSIDTEYWWRVKYRDSYGNWSAWSIETGFTTIDVLSPLTPVNVLPAANAVGASTTPTLTSSAFSDPDIGDTHSASQWQVSTDAGFVTVIYDSGSTTTDKTSITVPSGELSYNTIYYWRVSHIDSFGKASAWSTETKFTTATSPNPIKPVNTAPVGGATDVTLTPILVSSAFAGPDVGDDHEASHWQISTGTGGAFVANIMYDTSPTVDDLDDLEIESGTLTNSTTYYWRIRHQDSFGNWSEWSTETGFTTIAWHLPDKPTNLAPVDGGTDIVLTPTLIASEFHDADATDDHISSRWQVASDAGFTTIIYDSNVDTVNLSDIKIPSGFLEYDETYFWRVRYQDSSSQWSAWSDEFEFDAIATSVPVRPTNQAPTAGASGIGIRPTLAASAFNDPDIGDVHTASQWQITDTSGTYTVDTIVYDSETNPTNLTSVVISVLLDYNTIYYWQVRYKDSHGNWSTYSPETQFSTLASVKPSQPVISAPVTGTTVPSTTPTIQASDFEDADIGDSHKASKWQISTTSASYTTPLYDSGEDTTNLTSITIPEDELSEDTTYYLRVSYQDNFDNWSDWSAEISFKTTGAAANFIGSPTSANANQDVIFRDSSSGNITAWQWNFGDGTIVDWTAATRPAGGQITHAYTTEGTFTVSLEITTATGTNTKTESNYITVGGGAGGGDSMTTTYIIIGAVAAIAVLGGVYYYMRKQREG